LILSRVKSVLLGKEIKAFYFVNTTKNKPGYGRFYT
jgi:hypothetical protein